MLGIFCTAILVLIFGVFRPAFKKVNAMQKGIVEILMNVPRPVIRAISKHYSRKKLGGAADESDESSSDDDGDDDKAVKFKSAKSIENFAEAPKAKGSEGEDGAHTHRTDGTEDSETEKKRLRKERKAEKKQERAERREAKHAAHVAAAEEKKRHEHERHKAKHGKHGKHEKGAESGSEGEAAAHPHKSASVKRGQVAPRSASMHLKTSTTPRAEQLAPPTEEAPPRPTASPKCSARLRPSSMEDVAAAVAAAGARPAVPALPHVVSDVLTFSRSDDEREEQEQPVDSSSGAGSNSPHSPLDVLGLSSPPLQEASSKGAKKLNEDMSMMTVCMDLGSSVKAPAASHVTAFGGEPAPAPRPRRSSLRGGNSLRADSKYARAGSHPGAVQALGREGIELARAESREDLKPLSKGFLERILAGGPAEKSAWDAKVDEKGAAGALANGGEEETEKAGTDAASTDGQAPSGEHPSKIADEIDKKFTDAAAKTLRRLTMKYVLGFTFITLVCGANIAPPPRNRSQYPSPKAEPPPRYASPNTLPPPRTPFPNARPDTLPEPSPPSYHAVVYGAGIESSRSFAQEVMQAGVRRSLAREMMFFARELYLNQSIVMSRETMISRFQTNMELFREIDLGLKFGSPSLKLPGSDNRYAPQDRLNYDKNQCLAESGDCSDLTPRERAMFMVGLNSLTERYLSGCLQILQDNLCEIEGCTSQAKYTYSTSQSLKEIEIISRRYLDRGMRTAIDLYIQETEANIAMILMIEAVIMTIAFVFLTGLYFLLFKPMVRGLMDEANRTSQMLMMIPKRFIFEVEYLHSYFSNSVGDD
eukprot:tig00000178_g12765.t1